MIVNIAMSLGVFDSILRLRKNLPCIYARETVKFMVSDAQTVSPFLQLIHRNAGTE